MTTSLIHRQAVIVRAMDGGRIRIPPALRVAGPGELLLTVGREGSVPYVRASATDDLQIDIGHPSSRARRAIARAVRVRLSPSARLSIPPAQRQYAGLYGTAALIDRGAYFLIAAARYAAELEPSTCEEVNP